MAAAARGACGKSSRDSHDEAVGWGLPSAFRNRESRGPRRPPPRHAAASRRSRGPRPVRPTAAGAPCPAVADMRPGRRPS